MDGIKVFAAGLLIVAVLALVTWWEWSVWTECRSNGSSWMYCLRMIVR